MDSARRIAQDAPFRCP